MRRIHGVLAAATLALLAACSAGTSHDSAGSGAGQPEMAGDGASVADSPGRDADTELGDRQVITTAHATIVVDDPE